jgi:dTDP-L-rhamnose 4-epimerase
MNKILVTGGAGFIGSFIVDMLVEQGNEVLIYDNLDPQVHPKGKRPLYLNQSAKFIRGDVQDYERFAKALKGIEQIYHLAAKVGVGQSMYEISDYVEVNTGGTANLLDILTNNKNNVEKVLVAGSMSSYGEGRYRCDKDGAVNPPLRSEAQMARGDWELHCPICGKMVKPVPTTETKPQICNSIYALTKKDQEEMVLMWGNAYKIPAVALRFFNVYGPRQALSNPYTGVCAIFMSRIKNGHPPVIYEDGEQTRDFISVKDIARACVMAMDDDRADYQSFNVGTGRPTSVKKVAETLTKIYGKQIVPEVTRNFRKGDVRHCIADPSKIAKTIGFHPEIDFYSGMEDLVEWTETVTAEDRFEIATSELKGKGLIAR